VASRPPSSHGRNLPMRSPSRNKPRRFARSAAASGSGDRAERDQSSGSAGFWVSTLTDVTSACRALLSEPPPIFWSWRGLVAWNGRRRAKEPGSILGGKSWFGPMEFSVFWRSCTI
jgi:hypothetical protein